MIATEADAKAWLAQLPECDATALERMERLIVMLEAENEQQNLVSAPSLASVWQRHIVDSAQLLAYVPRETDGPWLDLGTGAGFPGLVIAILRPDADVRLIESRSRRIEWLGRALHNLGLSSARVVGSRLELVETCEARVISARAFAPLDRLIASAARFSTSDTLWLLPKGRSAGQELDMLRGWTHTFHVEQSITDPEAGVVVGTLTGARRGRKGPRP